MIPLVRLGEALGRAEGAVDGDEVGLALDAWPFWIDAAQQISRALAKGVSQQAPRRNYTRDAPLRKSDFI